MRSCFTDLAGSGVLLLALGSALRAPAPTISSIVKVPKFVVQSSVGVTNEIQFVPSLNSAPWAGLTNFVVAHSPYVFVDMNVPPASNRLYRVGGALGQRPVIGNISMAPKLTIESELGITNQIQATSDPNRVPWTTLATVNVVQSPYIFVDENVPAGAAFVYRVVKIGPYNQVPPTNMVLIPAGTFQMGDNLDGFTDAQPVHVVSVGAFWTDPGKVNAALWNEVYQWAVTNGYDFSSGIRGVSSNHPVHNVTWYDAVKWCNARSEREGREPAYYSSPAAGVYRQGQIDLQNASVEWNAGFRLPTEAEWEKAARGGMNGHRFPWPDTDTISQSRANFYSFWQNGQPFNAYDVSSTNGYHPLFATGIAPYTSPSGYFAANGYGVRDMAGILWEWCWDWWSAGYYGSSPGTDPWGPASGSFRVLRGGSWATQASGCRVASRGNTPPDIQLNTVGFRTVLPATPP